MKARDYRIGVQHDGVDFPCYSVFAIGSPARTLGIVFRRRDCEELLRIESPRWSAVDTSCQLVTDGADCLGDLFSTRGRAADALARVASGPCATR